ncbi:MAG: preprotein translocase subunit SecG [Phycisphaeraceae bacterium]
MLTLSAWYISLLSLLFVIVSVLMMLIILVQKPKGGGLSGAFGGAGGGSTQSAFGARVGDVLTWATVVFFLLFLFIAMGLTWTINPEQEQLKRQAAQNAAAPTATPEDAQETDVEEEDGPTAEEVIDQSTPTLPQSGADDEDADFSEGGDAEMPEPTVPDVADPDS